MPFKATNEELIRRLADTFAACRVGETVAYPDMAEAVGLDVLKHRYLIPRAQRLANVEVGAVFRNVRHVGYERLPQDEAHSKGQSARRRGRKMFKASIKQIENALRFANGMSQDAIRKNWGEITHLSLNVHQTYDQSAPVMPPEPLPPNPATTAAQSLERMRGALGRSG